MEKLVYIVHVLDLLIYEAFGSAGMHSKDWTNSLL